MDCYVRIQCPVGLDAEEIYVGHYDLIIDGVVDMGIFFPAEATNTVINRPVISYGGNSRAEIKPLSSFTGLNTSVFEYYQWKFSGYSAADISTLLAELKNVATEITAVQDNISFKPKGKFGDYSRRNANCFMATSIWLQWMGTNKLDEIIRKAVYMRYSPRLMQRLNGTSWRKVSA